MNVNHLWSYNDKQQLLQPYRFTYFSKKSEAMSQFFNKHGYPASVVPVATTMPNKLINSGQWAIFSQPSLISFKHDKNIGNFLARSSFQTNDQSGTFKFATHNAKLILSFITFCVPPPMSFTA